MAELQETQQEKEARWAAQRVARNAQDQKWRVARARIRRKISWAIVALVLLLALLGVFMLL
jgi:hypothetical protein